MNMSSKQVSRIIACLLIFFLTHNGKAQSYVYSSTSDGSSLGSYLAPVGISVDASSRVYIADPGQNKVFVTTQTVQTITLTLGGALGTGNGTFNRPVAVATDASGNIYVVDQLNHLVQKFSSNGTFILQWGGSGSGNTNLYSPSGIAIDASGNVYVADSGNDRIQKFSNTGTSLGRFGTMGSGTSQFNHPTGVAVDGSGNIYVADQNNHRMMKYNSSFVYQNQIGTGQGNTDGKFYAPYAVALDAGGNIFVSDAGNDRVQKFSNLGLFITKWGSFGTNGKYQFNSPQGIAVNSKGVVYVADNNNKRIQAYTPDFIFTPVSGPYGTVVTITGTGFNGVSSVSFNGTTAGAITVLNSNQINVAVPVGATTGPIAVVVGGISMTSSTAFTVTGVCYNCATQYSASLNWGGMAIWRGIATDGHSALYGIHDYKVVKYDLNGNFLMDWTINPLPGSSYLVLTSIAVDKYGNVYVACTDAISLYIAKFNSNGNLLMTIPFTSPGYNYIYGVAVDLSDNIFVSTGDTIFKFNSSGIGSPWYSSWSNNPDDGIGPIAVDPSGNVYFTTSLSHKVVKLNGLTTTIMDQWVSDVNPNNSFVHLALDRCNNVLVATEFQGVKKFTNSGTYISTVQSTYSISVACDGQGSIYISYPDIKKIYAGSMPVISSFTPSSGPAGTVVTITGNGFSNVTSINFNGTPTTIYSINNPTQITVTVPVGAETGLITLNVCDQSITSTGIYTINCTSQARRYAYIKTIDNTESSWGVATDTDGFIYATNQNTNSVVKYSANGAVVSVFDVAAALGTSSPMQLEGIAIDHNKNMYIADANNSRIIKLNASGQFVDFYGDASKLELPTSIALDETAGSLYVADHSNAVKSFNLTTKAFSSIVFVNTIGGNNDGPMDLLGVAVALNGDIYWTDESRNVVYKLVGGWAHGFLTLVPTSWSSSGAPYPQFMNYVGKITTDRFDNYYVIDQTSGSGRVVKFNSSGVYVGETDMNYFSYDLAIGECDIYTCTLYNDFSLYIFSPAISGFKTAAESIVSEFIDIHSVSRTNIYPNPSAGDFIISTSYDHYEMVLYNAQGLEVWKGESNANDYRLNDQSLTSGVYILKIISGSETEQTKLAIKK